MKMIKKSICFCVCFLNISLLTWEQENAIQIYSENPYYWAYKGKPVLLLGGSDDDNVFNWPDRQKVREQLELLASAGGNYDRCTMSGRDKGNARPFLLLDNGKYDLDHWNPEFWDRFDFYLEECRKRDIITQIEIWATYDIINPSSPFNPKNNIQQDMRRSTLDYSDSKNRRLLFYSTVPALNNDRIALKYQQKFIDKILEHAFRFDNVLYCIDNEYGWGMPEEWYEYWAEYLQEKAAASNKDIHITEMNQIDWDLLLKLRDNTPLTAEDKARLGDGNPVLTVKHKKMYSNTELFSYIDIGNSMGNSSPDEHWRHLQSIRDFIMDEPHPMNNTKLYGADYNSFWPGQEAVNKFWRNLIGGCASVRFHRPPAGQGLNEAAQNSIRSGRIFEKYVKPWECEPRMDIIADKGDHELYVMAKEGGQIACLIPNKITENDWIKLKLVQGTRYDIMWVNLETAEARVVKERHSSANWIAFSPPEFVYGSSGLVIFYLSED